MRLRYIRNLILYGLPLLAYIALVSSKPENAKTWGKSFSNALENGEVPSESSIAKGFDLLTYDITDPDESQEIARRLEAEVRELIPLAPFICGQPINQQESGNASEELNIFAQKDVPSNSDFATIYKYIRDGKLPLDVIIPNKWENTLLGRCAYHNNELFGLNVLNLAAKRDRNMRTSLVNMQNASGNTPLMQLARHKHPGLKFAAAILNTPGIDLNLRNREGETALDIAKQNNPELAAAIRQKMQHVRNSTLRRN